MQGEEAIATILKARSIAVVGASSHPEKWSYKTLESIVNGGYTGRIYPVNPKGGEILGLPVYRSLQEIPGEVELATLIIPVEAVTDALYQAAEKGVKTVVVTTAGYREGGHYEREVELKALAHELGLRILGPNLQGFIYTPNQLSAMFWPTVRMNGPLGIISHSGSVSAALAEWAVEDGVGISGLVNMGNQMDLCDADVLRFYCQDENTRAVALYAEGVRDGRAFIQAASELARHKPLVVLKGGQSAAGQRSVASHTGSLAGSHRIFTSACRQYGVQTAGDLESLFNMGKALATMRLTPGKRILVITSSGGGATLAVDEAERQGLVIPPLPPELVQELRGLNLHFNANLSNPLDLAGVTIEHFERAVMAADRYDVADTYLLVFADPIPGSTEAVKRLWSKTGRNLAVAYFGGGEIERTSRLEMQAAGIPVFRSSERAVQGIGAAVRAGEDRGRRFSMVEDVRPSRNGSVQAVAENRTSGFLPEPEAVDLIGRYAMPYPEHGLAHTVEEAVALADEVGYPAVLKVVSRQVIHKSDAGGVVAGLQSADDVRRACASICAAVGERLPEARLDGFLVCRQAPPGVEVIVGSLHDPLFGPVIMFGLGGVFTEVLGDVAFRLAPLGRKDAEEMIHEIKGYPLIAGRRGQKPCDEAALVELLLSVSRLVCEHNEIKELDLNPVRLYEDGLLVLDARVIQG